LAEHHPMIGEWVTFFFEKHNKPLMGYIVVISSDFKTCTVFVPSSRTLFRIPFSDAVRIPVNLGLDELRMLIDLALDTRDCAWFHKLVQELKRSTRNVRYTPTSDRTVTRVNEIDGKTL
jgi:hypothetical protein